MERANPGLLWAVVCLLIPGCAGAQSASVKTEFGLHRATFSVPQGTVRVNLPDDLAAGDTISGTVYTEPTGRNQREIDQHSGELTGYVVEMEGQKKPASERSLRCRIPARVGGGISTILLRDPKNKVVAKVDVPVDTVPQPPEAARIDLPTSGQSGSLTSAWGGFGDNPTAVMVGGKDAPLIAQSPRKIVFQAPPGLGGRTTISVKSGPLSAEGPFYALGLQLSTSQANLLRGQTAVMIAQVSGLEDLQDPAQMTILNRDPTVVLIEGGVAQTVSIPPSAVRPDGTFQTTRTLTGAGRGNYDISVIVSRPPSSQIPVERLAERTVDRWSRLSNVTVTPEARSLIASEVQSAHAALDEFLRSQVVYHPDAGSLVSSLVRDYCFDLRDAQLRALPRLGGLAMPRFAVGFAPQSPPAVTIGAGDVQKHPFLQYLGQLAARLTPSDAVGDLSVTSTPGQQRIVIDAKPGDYYTARTFVVSVGDHRVAVGACNDLVHVAAYEKKIVSCPH
jgi:hypothetical protein